MSGSTTGSQTGNFMLGNLLAPPGSYVDPTRAKDSFMPTPKDGQPEDTRQPWEQILMGGAGGGMGGSKPNNTGGNTGPVPGGDASQEALDGVNVPHLTKIENPQLPTMPGKGGARKSNPNAFFDMLLK